MTTSRNDSRPQVVQVECADARLRVVLSDGREVLIPISWFPRLERATDEQRRNWRLTPAGWGIHWPDVDEDLEVERLFSFHLTPVRRRQADQSSPSP